MLKNVCVLSLLGDCKSRNLLPGSGSSEAARCCLDRHPAGCPGGWVGGSGAGDRAADSTWDEQQVRGGREGSSHPCTTNMLTVTL